MTETNQAVQTQPVAVETAPAAAEPAAAQEPVKAPPERKPAAPKKEKNKFPYRTNQQCRFWYHLLYAVAFIIFRIMYGLKVYGRENIPEGAALICPRHCSAVDPPMVCFGMTRKHIPRLMAKQSLLEIPVVGRFIYMGGAFGVRRGENDMASVKNALKSLKDGSKLVMFPEGTRVKEGETPHAQTGAIMFALKADVPIVPVYLTRAKRFRTMKMVFGKPYKPQIAGKRATPEEYRQLADELLEKIYDLESQAA